MRAEGREQRHAEEERADMKAPTQRTFKWERCYWVCVNCGEDASVCCTNLLTRKIISLCRLWMEMIEEKPDVDAELDRWRRDIDEMMARKRR
jgi:hypothetical protein